MAQAVLYVVAEDPQIEYVAQDVEPSAMQKHGGNKGQEKMYGAYVQEEICRDTSQGGEIVLRNYTEGLH